MRNLAALCLFCLTLSCAHPTPMAPEIPSTRQSDHVDVYHGVAVKDPYRWLEDPDSAETQDWVARQNAATQGFLQAIPKRKSYEQRLSALWNFPRTSPPSRRGGRWFWSRNDGLQNQAVLYWSEGLGGAERILLDPNTWSADGTKSLASMDLSDDGRYIAYGVSTGGSDWNEIEVVEVSTGSKLMDRIQWVKFSSPTWHPDGSGFFYARYPSPEPGAELQAVNRNQKLWFHRLGTTQDEDQLVYERTDQPDWGFQAAISDDDRYLIIHASLGTDRRNRVFIKDLTSGEVVGVFVDFDAAYDYVGNDGPRFWFRTDQEAPRGRVIEVALDRPERSHWKTLIPESAGTISEVRAVGDRLVVVTMEDVKHLIRLFTHSGGKAGEILLPSAGTVGQITGRREDRELFLTFSSFLSPTSVYRYSLDSSGLSLHSAPKVDFDADRFETRQVWYPSKDGTRIPMYLVHRRGLKPTGDHRVLLYGYGGFNIPIMPGFSVPNAVWLEEGSIYAQPALRGGSEYGEAWHEAGMLEKKQNVFDDFIGAAEWLIAEGWTTPSRIATYGGSNGGLLVGACMTQRPDLFGAVLPAVGVMDMLRFHEFTIGWAWVSEYGSSADPGMFPVLRGYSPLHTLKPGTAYPATMVLTADRDDRVVPAHSFKFAAALQAAQGGPAPCLIRIETQAGHGAGVPMAKLIEEASDRLAFLDAVLED